ARKHAEHAVELGKDRATAAQMLLAEIQFKQNQRAEAEKTLQTLAEMAPPAPESKQAADILAVLRKQDQTLAAARASAKDRPGESAGIEADPAGAARELARRNCPPQEGCAPTTGMQDGTEIAAVADLPLRGASPAQPLVPEAKWMPPDVDESMPAVEAGV